MKKLLALLLLLLPVCAIAQPAYTTITASNILDAGGNALASGKITFTPGDNFGNAMAARGMFYRAASCYVVAGAVTTATGGGTCKVVDALASNPNLCYHITLFDSITGQSIPTPGHICAQPTGTSWSYDSYVPNMAPATLVQSGPTGPTGATGATGAAATVSVGTVTTGAAGTSAAVTNGGTSGAAVLNFTIPRGSPGLPGNWRGAWAGGTTYAAGDLFTNGGYSYIVTNGYTAGSTFGSTDTTNASIYNQSGGLGTAGATGNQLSLDKAIPGLYGTGSTGNFGGGIDYNRFGDSTVAYDQGDLGLWYATSQLPGQPLYGTMLIKKLTSPYTCSSNNYVFTVDNSTGWAVAGDYVQTNGPIVVTGSLTQEEFNERYAIIVSATATTVTIAYASGSATVNCTTGGSWSGTGVISPNATRNGNPGATLSSMSGTALTNTLAVMSAKAAAGYTPAFVMRAGINDWRLNKTNLPTFVALVKSVLSSVQGYSGLSGIPMVYIVPNAVNAAGVPLGNSGNNAMCQAGQTGTGNCAAGTIAAPTLSGSISAGANSVTLTNPTGQTYCPFWIGPGAPFELTSNGNTFQVVLNYGGGNQETVTVTAFSANVTDNTHYTCNLSFTTANAHSSGEPVMFTNLWMSQWMTDAMNYAGGAVLKMAATTFPTLKVLNTQDLIYGHYASPTTPGGMVDALHPNGYLEDNYLGALFSSITAQPTFLVPDRPAQNLTTGGTYNEFTWSNLTNFDPYFSEQAANNWRSVCGYWNTGSVATYCYPLWAEDLNYFKVQFVGSLSGPYTAGTTGTVTLTSLTTNTVDIRGNSSYAALSDILCVAGVGCWPGLLTATPGGAGGYQVSLTVGNGGIPVNLPTNSLIYVMRYRSYDYSGVPYLRNPGSFYHAPQGYLSAGGSNTYTITLFGGNNGALAEFMSNGVGTVYTIGSSPITAASIGTAGSGYDNGGTGTDTVTLACGATVVVNTTSGVPSSVSSITSAGTNCSSGTNLTTTGGTGTGLKLTVTAGTFTAPSGTTCSQSGGSTITTLACTDSSGTNYSYLVGLPVDMWSSTPPDGQFSNVATTCLKLKETGTSTPGYASTLCGAASYGNQRTLTLQDSSGTIPLEIAAGTSALGTSAVTAGTCASVVTTTATSAATTDTISWAFNAAPGTGYTAGLHVLAYPTSGNVNFLVCNPTAGSLTPAAATLNWRVIR